MNAPDLANQKAMPCERFPLRKFIYDQKSFARLASAGVANPPEHSIPSDGEALILGVVKLRDGRITDFIDLDRECDEVGFIVFHPSFPAVRTALGAIPDRRVRIAEPATAPSTEAKQPPEPHCDPGDMAIPPEMVGTFLPGLDPAGYPEHLCGEVIDCMRRAIEENAPLIRGGLTIAGIDPLDNAQLVVQPSSL